MYESLAASCVFDPEARAFMEKSNPRALGGIAERLLETADRGLWAELDDRTLDRLRQVHLELPGEIEGEVRQSDRVSPLRSPYAPRTSPRNARATRCAKLSTSRLSSSCIDSGTAARMSAT